MSSTREIQQSYENCLYKAIIWLNGNNYQVHPKSVTVIPAKDASGNVIVRTSQPLHFRDWPQRHDSAEKIDIVASIVETISLADGVCVKATVKMNYFRADGEKAIATESLHYDYAVPLRKQHAICHAQNSNKLLEGRPESFTRKVESEVLLERCQNVRIPTAFVNMPGLFTILAADHMTSSHWSAFMNHCLPHFRRVPGLPGHDVVDKGVSDARLCVWGWHEI